MTAASHQRLVGRERELDRVDRLVSRVAAGRGESLVLVGEAGIGKSSLVGAAVEGAHHVGLALGVGQCANLSIPRPLQAWHEALGLARVRAPAEALRTGFAVAGSGADALLAADHVLQAIEERAAVTPLLLVVEDLHWADPLTLAVAAEVCAMVDDLALGLILTTRPPPPGSEVAQVVAQAASATLAIGPLDPNEVSRLAATVLGGAPDTAMAAALGTAGGNPLVVMALLDSSVDLARRAADLPSAVLGVLQVAAILGSTPEPDDVAHLAEVSAAELVGVLDEAAQSGFVVTAPALAFRHDLYRDAVLATLSPTAQELLHLSAARQLAAIGAPTVDVAEHYLGAARPGDTEAISWLTRAADELVSYTPATARRLVDGAVALAVPGPEPELLRTMVKVLVATGDAPEAERLATTLLHDGLPAEIQAGLHRELAFAYLILGRARESREAIERAAALNPDPHLSARAQAEVAFGRLVDLDFAGAAEAAAQASDLGVRLGDVAAQVGAGGVQCWTELFSGDLPAATTTADRITALAEMPHVSDGHLYQPWFIAGLAYLEADRHRDLARATRLGRERASTAGYAWSAPGYDALDAFGHLRRGELADAEAVASATVGYVDGVDGFGVALWCHGFLAQIAVHRGEEPTARAHLERATAHLATGRAQFGFDQLTLGTVLLAEDRGDVAGAYKCALEAWELFGAIGIPTARQEIGALVVRLGLACGQAGDLARVVDEMDAVATRSASVAFAGFGRLAAAWHRGDPRLATGAAELLERAGRHLAAADAWRDAGLLARSSAGRSAVNSTDADADASARRAVALYRACGADAAAARVADLVSRGRPRVTARARFGWEAVTATELSVAELAGAGLTNTAIAAQLGISRRTVESHVGALHRKLEISSRGELVRAVLTRSSDPG